jgi:hypothetical protein
MPKSRNFWAGMAVLPVGLVEEDRGEVVGGGSGREKWRELMGTVSSKYICGADGNLLF